MVAAARPPAGGYISAHELYTLEEIETRLHLGAAALRTARRKGLRVSPIGRRRFVLGADLIAFIGAQGDNESSRPSAQTPSRP